MYRKEDLVEKEALIIHHDDSNRKNSRGDRQLVFAETGVSVRAINSSMGGGATSRGGRAARALRLLLLLVLALVAFEYLFDTIDGTSPRKAYTPLHDATHSTDRDTERLDLESSEVQFTKIQKQNLETETDVKNNNLTTFNSTNILNRENDFTAKEKSANDVNVTFIPLNSEQGEDEFQKVEANQTLCDETPPGLGPIPVNKEELELDDVEKKYPEIQQGGHYVPPNCTARHKVAIIIPYKDRQQHLAIFLNHMHPFLMKQQIEYGIFVIEQHGDKKFNRAKLMNVGFAESQKLEPGGWQCFIFHDIDLLPSDTRNMYTCPDLPRHMSAAIDKFKYKLPYSNIFGGVSAITNEQFTKVNGFSNKYWGWGGEDDDMFARLKKMNYPISRYNMSIARYIMLDHSKSTPNPKRFKLLSQTGKTFMKDGLSTLEYELVQVVRYHLYTYILANIDERS